MLWYFLTFDKWDRITQHKHTTNTTAMVVEPFAPPVAWIQWIHATQEADNLAHILSKATVEGFF